MRIGYVVQSSPDIMQPPFDGPANHIRHVVTEMILLGHEVMVIFGLEGKYYKSSDLEQFENVMSKKRSFLLTFVEKAIRRVQTVIHLPYFAWYDSNHFARLCQEHLIDSEILIERTGWMAYGGCLASRRLKIPIVQEFNGDPVIDLRAKNIAPSGFQGWLSRQIYRQNLLAANAIIATGDGWRDMLLDNWKIPERLVNVVENGSILVSYLQRNQLKVFSERKSEDDQTPHTIVFLGGFYAWHGTDLLIRAFEDCLNTHPNLKLVLIGAGMGLEESKRIAKSKGLSENITFTGQLSFEQYAPILATADIAVSPVCGRKEYSCLKLFDYKAAGLAIISSGEGDQPATLKHGITGWLVPPCDHAALSKALLMLLSDQSLRMSLGQQARLDSEIQNGWSHTAETVINVCASVLSNRSSVDG